MSNHEVLVRDEVTAYGQHWMEVLGTGESIDRECWMERVPMASLHLAKAFERCEAALGTRRLYLWWPAREAVRLDPGWQKRLGINEAVLWYVEPGMTIRNAAENAAAAYFLSHDVWPERLLLQKKPAGAPDILRLQDCPDVVLTIEEVQDLPRGYIMVARRAE